MPFMVISLKIRTQHRLTSPDLFWAFLYQKWKVLAKDSPLILLGRHCFKALFKSEGISTSSMAT